MKAIRFLAAPSLPFLAGALLAHRPRPTRPPAVRLVEAPLPAASVREIGGFVGRRFRANRDGYLKAFDIDRYTRMVEAKTYRDWWFIGEQPGKWLESAALTSRVSGDKDLEGQARQVLARLVAAQEPGGYLGITDPALRTDQTPLRGMEPYELYFTLHGLMTAFETWDDADALHAACRAGGLPRRAHRTRQGGVLAGAAARAGEPGAEAHGPFGDRRTQHPLRLGRDAPDRPDAAALPEDRGHALPGLEPVGRREHRPVERLGYVLQARQGRRRHDGHP